MKVRSRLGHNLRWAAALLLAGLCSCWTRRGWVRIGRAAGLWFGLVGKKDRLVDPATYARRIKACEQCVIFYKPLRTCGTPLKRELRPHGCWCFMDEAAKLHEKECYLDTDIQPGYPGGWRDTALQEQRRNHG